MVEAERFIAEFGIRRGVTALIGGGGKTSLLLALADWLRPHGSVIVTTSTHIYPPDGLPYFDALPRPLEPGECVAVGTLESNGKLSAPHPSFETLCRLADYVVCEADGSRGLPLKAHAAYEPVIPPGCETVLAVLGLDGVGRTIRDAAHRPERYAAGLGVSEDTVVTPVLAAKMLRTYKDVNGFVLNKADDASRIAAAREIAALLPQPIAITALQPNRKILEIRRNGICLLS